MPSLVYQFSQGLAVGNDNELLGDVNISSHLLDGGGVTHDGGLCSSWGDISFCSHECRQQRMDQDELKRKELLTSKRIVATSSSTGGDSFVNLNVNSLFFDAKIPKM
ncbi:hypothetical protein Cni_G06329 [Canna indica]|uniref:FLZ-type domain-containing protein n=1 Tax=Canna indica TaxID=4628 RepID=A0AAQ3JWR8_9LILI|nr:hypothetical protein Cni_G06329 [Canna indica]